VSSRFEFALAGPADDAQLRARMAEDRMEGTIAVSFRREPSYFAGCRVQGDATQVVKCVERESGRIVGLGSRSTLQAHVNGRPERIGYLADLRAAPRYRRGTLLARGYRFLRRLHAQDPVPFYTTVIYEGNAPALQALVGGRAGLPVYRERGRLLTPALRLDLERPALAQRGLALARGDERQLPRIVEFLNRWQSEKQFAPLYRAADFGDGRFQGLHAADFFLALANGRIVATLAAWDQAAFRQTHVERYSAALACLRPFYNACALVSPLRPLPPAGARVPHVYLACIAAERNDPQLLRWLLREMYRALRRGRWHYAIAALHEADPLADVLADYRRIPAAGRLFVVHYPEAAGRVATLDSRVPYVEAGCL
jgi:hypothetical protein